MKILVGCEESGKVRSAFRAIGHDAWSCDLLPARDGSQYHIEGDVIRALSEQWDMGIFFPPCTRLCSSGARWFSVYPEQHEAAKTFFMAFASATHIPKRAIENPVGVMSTYYRKPDQIIQPWMFGHGETKATCLWLFSLPKLRATDVVTGRLARIHRMSPSATRSRDRSETYSGIATAMAEQWGNQ